MDGFADLLTDAFSESSVPSFSDGDLDFESLGFGEKGEEDEAENSTTNRDEALLQEVTDESEALQGEATTEALLSAEDEESTGDEDDEEEFERQESEESRTSSEEERSPSGEDVGAAGDLLMSVCCSDDPYDAQIKDGVFAEGQLMAAEGADSPKDSNKVQGEGESDEEASCIRGLPECGGEMVMKEKTEESKGEEEESFDSDHEDMTAEQEENVPTQETENLHKISPVVEDDLEFPCLSLQNLQDLVTEVDGEEQVLKMTDFTGDEHQEAGETIADYPSDFSSGEFSRAELNGSPLLPKQEPGVVTETRWISGIQESRHEKDDGFLYSTDLKMNSDKITSPDGATGEEREHELAVMGENNSYSSDDDEELLRRTKNELMSVRDVDNAKLGDVQLHKLSRWSSSDDTVKNRGDPEDLIRSCLDTVKTNTRLSEYLSTEDTDETEDSSSDENQHPAEDEHCHSVVQKVTASASNQGSIDDSFFFDTDSSEHTEQLVDDEEEEKRNAEQMQERIEAFKRFYDSDDETGRAERQIKVQFCADPLSQVNYYDTDSSDRDSLSSSTDTEEDLNYDDPREPEDLLREHGDRAEPEDLLREHGDRAEPEDLLREHGDRAEPEDLLREHGDRAEPEDLLKEHADRAEPEDLLREHGDRAEPEDLLREFEDALETTPVWDPPQPEQPQSVSEVRDLQTCTKTRKGVSKLRLMFNLGVVMMTGLLMFWLITDQPDWLKDIFSV